MDTNTEPVSTPNEQKPNPLTTVTTLSKYLALTLFILLPFLGGYIGYVYSPEKVMEIDNSGPGNWALQEKTFPTEKYVEGSSEITFYSESNKPVTGCDDQAFTVGLGNDKAQEWLGLRLPTLLGHVWSETSAGTGSQMWQHCKNIPTLFDSSIKLHVRLPAYVIPNDCITQEGEFGNLVCSTNEDGTTPVIVKNGSTGFFDTLQAAYADDGEWESFDVDGSTIPIKAFSDDSQVVAVVSSNEGVAFTIQFIRDTYSDDFIRAYLSSIQKL